MKIYTKTGDKGKTSLFTGKRVLKSNELIGCFGLLDELNVFIGALVELLGECEQKKDLIVIQNHLFSAGSYLASSFTKKEYIVEISSWTLLLEEKIDRMTTELPVLKNFILPGGGKKSIAAHLCRVKARNVERYIVAMGDLEKTKSSLAYLNRLSDYFFVLARFFNHQENREEITWTA